MRTLRLPSYAEVISKLLGGTNAARSDKESGAGES
jgi:hypothetical protein